VLSAGLVLGAMSLSASAALTTITSTVDQSGYLGSQNAPGGIIPLTGTASPYDFTNAGGLSSLTDISVTLTSINDGDTATGNFDNGNLFLALNGINTGIALDGLPDGQASSITVHGTPSAATATALLAALQANPKLIGTIIDTTPTNAPAGDIIGISSAVQTTLSLTGEGAPTTVPLPAAAIVAPLGAGLAGIYSRRFRKAK